MATDLTLISEMVTVLGAATIGGFVASRSRQPVLLVICSAASSLG